MFKPNVREIKERKRREGCNFQVNSKSHRMPFPSPSLALIIAPTATLTGASSDFCCFQNTEFFLWRLTVLMKKKRNSLQENTGKRLGHKTCRQFLLFHSRSLPRRNDEQGILYIQLYLREGKKVSSSVSSQFKLVLFWTAVFKSTSMKAMMMCMLRLRGNERNTTRSAWMTATIDM